MYIPTLSVKPPRKLTRGILRGPRAQEVTFSTHLHKDITNLKGRNHHWGSENRIRGFFRKNLLSGLQTMLSGARFGGGGGIGWVIRSWLFPALVFLSCTPRLQFYCWAKRPFSLTNRQHPQHIFVQPISLLVANWRSGTRPRAVSMFPVFVIS